MTENQMCPAVSGSGLPCALLEDHARPSPDYPHISIEGHQFQRARPAVKEPSGDVVVATRSGWFFTPGGTLGWVRDDRKPYTWEQVVEFGEPVVYRNEVELTELSTEVLRVGIGEPQPRPVEELVGVLTDPNWGQDDAYLRGRRDFAEVMSRDLSALRAEALSAERKDAYDKALATVAALLGES